MFLFVYFGHLIHYRYKLPLYSHSTDVCILCLLNSLRLCTTLISAKNIFTCISATDKDLEKDKDYWIYIFIKAVNKTSLEVCLHGHISKTDAYQSNIYSI